MNFSKPQLAIIAIIIANTIWGAGSPIFKWTLQEVQPFTLAFFRFFIPAIFIFLLVPVKDLTIERKDWFKLFLLAFSGITVNIAFYFLALQLTNSINAPIIASASPILIMTGGALFFHEKLTKNKIIGGTLGLLGVLIIVLMPVIDKGFDGSVTGNIFLILSAVGSVVAAIVLKDLSVRYNSYSLVFWSFLIGSLFFIPLFLRESATYGLLHGLTYKGIFGILYGAIFSSSIAYFLQYWSLRYLPVSEMGLFTYLDPVIAIVIAVPLLHEIPDIPFIIGAALVFGGIYIAERRIPYHALHMLQPTNSPPPQPQRELPQATQ